MCICVKLTVLLILNSVERDMKTTDRWKKRSKRVDFELWR